MAQLKNGRSVSVRRQAIRALRNAQTRADKKATAEEREATLRRGEATAISWLNGTHEKLAAS
jgi:hypothetical protein